MGEQHSHFLDRVNHLERFYFEDNVLDYIYTHIYCLIEVNQLDSVNKILLDAMSRLPELTISSLLGLLTVTLPVKKSLPARPIFFGRVTDYLLTQFPLEEVSDMMEGLE